jgi:hypothetical protein
LGQGTKFSVRTMLVIAAKPHLNNVFVKQTSHPYYEKMREVQRNKERDRQTYRQIVIQTDSHTDR